MNSEYLELTSQQLKNCELLQKTFKNKEALRALGCAQRRYERAWKNNALSIGDYRRHHNDGNTFMEVAKQIENKSVNRLNPRSYDRD